MQQHTIALIGEEPLKRGSEVMKQWMHRQGKKATLRELYAILKELDMVLLKEHLESLMEN